MRKILPGVEKRRHPRQPVALELRAKTLSGSILDLSQGGMLLESAAELEAGSSIRLKSGAAIDIRGDVLRVLKTGALRRYGVRFHKIDFDGKEVINARFQKAKAD